MRPRSSSLSRQKTQTEKNCQICFQPYDLLLKKPYLICSNDHLTCKQCIEIIEQNPNSKCPFCKTQIVSRMDQNMIQQLQKQNRRTISLERRGDRQISLQQGKFHKILSYQRRGDNLLPLSQRRGRQTPFKEKRRFHQMPSQQQLRNSQIPLQLPQRNLPTFSQQKILQMQKIQKGNQIVKIAKQQLKKLQQNNRNEWYHYHVSNGLWPVGGPDRQWHEKIFFVALGPTGYYTLFSRFTPFRLCKICGVPAAPLNKLFGKEFHPICLVCNSK